MTDVEERASLDQRFADILADGEAFLGEDILTAFLRTSDDTPFIDIDRVWHRGGLIEKLVDLLEDAFAEWNLEETAEYETIVAASSSIASYGSIPIAASLAARLKKQLCVLSQAANGDYSLYPSTLSLRYLLDRKKVLILHDAIVYGNSVARVAQFLTGMNAEVRALVVLLDQQPRGRDLPQVLQDVMLCTLTTGPGLAELIKGG